MLGTTILRSGTKRWASSEEIMMDPVKKPLSIDGRACVEFPALGKLGLGRAKAVPTDRHHYGRRIQYTSPGDTHQASDRILSDLAIHSPGKLSTR